MVNAANLPMALPLAALLADEAIRRPPPGEGAEFAGGAVVAGGLPPKAVVAVVAAGVDVDAAALLAIDILVLARCASRLDRMLTSANSMSDEKAKTRHVDVQTSIALM